MSDAWGSGWDAIAGVAVVAAAVYLCVFAALRVAGRRTVSQMSAFDFVVTIAIGSLVATTILTPDISFARGLTAIVTLLFFQQLVAMIRQRLPSASRLLDFRPETLYERGEKTLRKSPLTAQVTWMELESKLRQKGIGSLEEVSVVVLEPDGRISVWRAGEGDTDLPQLWKDPVSE